MLTRPINSLRRLKSKPDLPQEYKNWLEKVILDLLHTQSKIDEARVLLK